MNETLRAKIIGKLDVFPDEHARQLLDYIDFLESKYNRSRRAPSPLQRLAENIEDALGTSTLSEAATKGTAQVVDAAGRVMSGLVAAGKAVADELASQPASTAGTQQPQENGASGDEAPPEEEPDQTA
jgi:hypothetical protein